MFHWDPYPVAFTIPYLNLPIYIYGICFVTGFILGYQLLHYIMQREFPVFARPLAQKLLDQLTWFVVGGTIVGARLGHVLFYDWERYKHQPWQIFNTREGGLASHGGAIGVLLALGIYYYFFFRKKTGRSFLNLLDMIVIPTALVAVFIRIGNFFNQEITGIPTQLPWGIIFGHAADGSAPLPRHPAQLYEALAYLGTFGLLLYLFMFTKMHRREGWLSGLFFILIFGSRFFIEFVKASQASIFNQNLLQAGQWLSIPFILGGFGLLWFSHSPRTQSLKM